jgi:AcrR family transcriptional regulator
MGEPEPRPPRRRHPRGRGARRRGELVDAATRLLADLGDAERLSLRAVAAATGISAPSIYRHFPDKPALLRAVVEERFQEFDRLLDRAEGAGADPFDALRRRCRAYVRYAKDNPGHYRILATHGSSTSRCRRSQRWSGRRSPPARARFGTPPAPAPRR